MYFNFKNTQNECLFIDSWVKGHIDSRKKKKTLSLFDTRLFYYSILLLVLRLQSMTTVGAYPYGLTLHPTYVLNVVLG